jgi:hypothetical protein
MANLSERDRSRLAAILGMLGSNAVGERENAGQLAEQFRRQHGLTWAELLALKPADDAPREEPGEWQPPKPPPPANPHSAPSQRALAHQWLGMIATAIAIIMVVIVVVWFGQVDRPPASISNSHSSRGPTSVTESVPRDDTAALSVEQRNKIGDHVRECWTTHRGSPSAELVQVLLLVTTDQAGVARRAVVADPDQDRLGDPNFRAFAERAKRAVLDPQCASLPLPTSMLGRINMFTLRINQ